MEEITGGHVEQRMEEYVRIAKRSKEGSRAMTDEWINDKKPS